MAGTIVADTLQDGAGNSTATTNAIKGSAKAWANFGWNGTTTVINGSYNVSSVTRTASGNYTMNYTNAFSNSNYAAAFAGQRYYAPAANMCIMSMPSSTTTLATLPSSISVICQDQAGNQNDSIVVCITCFSN